MEKDNIIELEIEEGVIQHCVVLGFFEIGDIEYVGLMPIETEDCYIFRYEEDDEMNPVLGAIETDEEFKEASEVLDELLEALYENEEE